MAKVPVWRSQLVANDFPPVCVMTGAPAETWRKFNFSDSPWWAFWLGGILLAAATARRASGYLPLTRTGARSIRLVRLTPLVFVAPAAAFFVAAAVAAGVGGNSTAGSATTVYSSLFGTFLGLMAFMVLLLTHRYGPVAKVREPHPGYDLIVELDHVHPAFVSAVKELQQARAAQHPFLA